MDNENNDIINQELKADDLSDKIEEMSCGEDLFLGLQNIFMIIEDSKNR